MGNPVVEKEHKESDVIINPPYYRASNGLEVYDVIRGFTEGLMGEQAVNQGNIIKYILRWPKKNGLEDLKKARWYLDKMINEIEKEEK